MVRSIFPLVILWLAGCATDRPTTTASEASLAAQMVERLSVMIDVALYKYHHEVAIEAPDRERELLERLEAQGTERGIPPTVVRDFFRAQMEAAKIVQREKLRLWASGEEEAPQGGIPDLAKEVRPVLDRLSESMLNALREEWLASQADDYPIDRHRSEVVDILRRAGFSEAATAMAISGLPRNEPPRHPLSASQRKGDNGGRGLYDRQKPE